MSKLAPIPKGWIEVLEGRVEKDDKCLTSTASGNPAERYRYTDAQPVNIGRPVFQMMGVIRKADVENPEQAGPFVLAFHGKHAVINWSDSGADWYIKGEDEVHEEVDVDDALIQASNRLLELDRDV